MDKLNFLIKPASSACDLNCKYCFYEDVSDNRETKNSGIMDKRTMINLIDKALYEVKKEITFAFQGGEPMLAGLPFYKSFVNYVKINKKPTQTIYYTLQTNGYSIDEEWCNFFSINNFLIGVSLDGYKENHDYFRLTKKKTGTYIKVMDNIKVLRNSKVEFNILTVLSAQLAKEPKKLYQFYKDKKISYIQLIPCLSPLGEKKNEFSLTPKSLAIFYSSFYDLWLKDFQNNKYLSISLFDNIILMLKGIMPSQCGMLGFCTPQFIIESNGNVYSCDFYALDKYCAGNINEDSIDKIAKSKVTDKFIKEEKKLCSKCINCPFYKICYGNCKRQNNAYFDENYCGYQEFLFHAYPSMRRIAEMLKQ